MGRAHKDAFYKSKDRAACATHAISRKLAAGRARRNHRGRIGAAIAVSFHRLNLVFTGFMPRAMIANKGTQTGSASRDRHRRPLPGPKSG